MIPNPSWRSTPGARAAAVLLVALSLSIGWGIRGNFGHEAGAMLPGALAAIAACLVSGREDWRERVHFFGLFGGLGWAFGGSIAYMYVVSFSGSEHTPTAIYGFFSAFITGGLWAGMGGAGTALPAAMNRERITAFITPLCVVLAFMAVNLPLSEVIENWIKSAGADGTWNRQRSPIYWLDADWFPAFVALAGVCFYDLCSRRFGKWPWLPVFSGAGALLGLATQWLLNIAGLAAPLASLLVVPLGDPAAINPDTGQAYGNADFITNWPGFAHDYPQHLGWGLGLLLGAGLYFYRFGAWRNDSKLLLYLSLGWLAAFVAMPVLGTIPLRSVGGFRLMPPRSDDWAGITGVFIAATLYCLRHGLKPVAFAGSLSGIIGGVSFAAVPFIRSMAQIPGHPHRTPGGTPPEWAHFQHANWHSILEQSHGFGHGIAIAVTMAVLAAWIKPMENTPRVRRWTDVFAVAAVLFGLTWLNISKNVPEWTEGARKVVPEIMKAPLVGWEISAFGWFMAVWLAATAAFVLVLRRHLSRPVALMPATWTGRGQFLFLALLWMMVIANFERALPNFHESRLVTEWVVFMNAVLASVLVLLVPRENDAPSINGRAPSLRRLWLIAAPVMAVLMVFFALASRGVYGNAPTGGPTVNHKRFGEEAHWRIKPILKSGQHR